LTEVVVPGEKLGEGEPGNNVYVKNGTLHSEIYGFPARGDRVSVIPVRGKYVPDEGDQIVGIVTDVDHSIWTVDLNSPYDAILHISRVERNLDQGALEQFMGVGEAMRAVIDEVDREMDVELSLGCNRCGPLEDGRVLTVEPAKVPRLIGRDGDMVRTIRSKSGADVFVGNNGRVWIQGDAEAEELAAKAVNFIAENAHRDDLTDKVKKFMEENR